MMSLSASCLLKVNSPEGQMGGARVIGSLVSFDVAGGKMIAFEGSLWVLFVFHVEACGSPWDALDDVFLAVLGLFVQSTDGAKLLGDRFSPRHSWEARWFQGS